MPFAAGCGDDSVEPAEPLVVTAPEEPIPADPMSVIPADIRLWDDFDAKRILKQPDTNTLVVEGTLPGFTEDRVVEMEATATADGWMTNTLSTNTGLATLIMSKDSRRLKVNLTQNGQNTSVYLTTRLPD